MEILDHFKQIDNLLLGKSNKEKIKFCNQCLEEPNKYTNERIFALKEYLNNLNDLKGRNDDGN